MEGSRLLRYVLLAALVGFCQTSAASVAAPPASADCPRELPAGTRCYDGADANDAYYWIAIPANWNQVLVIHAHGGPDIMPPKSETPVSDLQRFAVIVHEGFAYAGSSYRHAGFGVRD